MIKIKKYYLFILTAALLSFNSCQNENYQLGDIIVPSNVDLTYEIVGADALNPYGDGSGYVEFFATSDNEITYNFDFGDGKDNQVEPSGNITYLFTTNGINTYYVTVNAIGTGGISSSKTIPVTVYCSFKDEEAVEFLTGGSSKSWYWAADQTGHLGLGPNDKVYGGGDHFFPAWYKAAPFEKSYSSLYECEFIFTKSGDDLTFEHLNPTGEAFIQGHYATALGLGAEGSHPFDIAGVKIVSFSPSNSIATIPGNYRGTTMTFSDNGFMGFYAGSNTFEIIVVTENILKVRMVQPNVPLFAWYHTFTTVKP